MSTLWVKVLLRLPETSQGLRTLSPPTGEDPVTQTCRVGSESNPEVQGGRGQPQAGGCRVSEPSIPPLDHVPSSFSHTGSRPQESGTWPHPLAPCSLKRTSPVRPRAFAQGVRSPPDQPREQRYPASPAAAPCTLPTCSHPRPLRTCQRRATSVKEAQSLPSESHRRARQTTVSGEDGADAGKPRRRRRPEKPRVSFVTELELPFHEVRPRKGCRSVVLSAFWASAPGAGVQQEPASPSVPRPAHRPGPARRPR